MLPNTPDKASFHDKALERATRAKTVVVAIAAGDDVEMSASCCNLDGFVLRS
jgi:hypothetical protein